MQCQKQTVIGKRKLLPYIFSPGICHWDFFGREWPVCFIIIFSWTIIQPREQSARVPPVGICARNGCTICVFGFLDKHYEGFTEISSNLDFLVVIVFLWCFPKAFMFLRSLKMERTLAEAAKFDSPSSCQWWRDGTSLTNTPEYSSNKYPSASKNESLDFIKLTMV